MTVGGALLLYAVVVGFLGPAGLRRVNWPLRAPRLGAAAVLALAWSVLAALLLAGLTIGLPASALTLDIGHLIGACLNRLRAAYASPGGTAVVLTGQVLTAGLAARVIWVAGRLAVSRRREQQRHRLLIRLAGRRLPDTSAVVLDTADAAAYCLAGRHPAVIVTRGAVDVLSAQQLRAVVAHEQAHLRAGHHRRLAAASLAARTLPFVPLLRETPVQLARLLEMDADALAADEHEPRVLASALVAVGTAGPSHPNTPRPRSGATTLTGGDSAARIRRLLRPPEQLPPRLRSLTRAGLVAVTAGPVLLAAMPGLLALH